MSDAKFEKDAQAADNLKSYCVTCPHCGGHVSIDIAFRWRVRTVTPWNGDDPKQPKKSKISEEQSLLLDKMEANGLLVAFTDVIEKAVPVSHRPSNPRTYILTWLRTCMPKRVPQYALDAFISCFGGRVEVFGAQGILAVISDNRIRAFVPEAVAASGVAPGSGGFVKYNPEDLHIWLRTKMGYVPDGTKEFLSALRRRAIGEFAKPSQ